MYTAPHDWAARDRYFVPVPYFHIFGCMGGTAANCKVQKFKQKAYAVDKYGLEAPA